MIFDTHAHYDDDAFDEDRETLLSGMKDAGVEYIVNVGASMASSARSVALAEKYPFVYAAVGVHPDEVGELNEENFEQLRNWSKLEKVKHNHPMLSLDKTKSLNDVVRFILEISVFNLK